MEQRESEIPPRRDLRVDALKGLGILLVVLRHAIPWTQGGNLLGLESLLIGPPWIPEFLRHPSPDLYGSILSFLMNISHSFFMPLFAFLSGYLLVGKPQGEDLAARRFRQLMVPYICWLLVNCVLYSLVVNVPPLLLVKTVSGSLGFFYELFMATCMFVVVRIASKRTGVLVTCAVAAIVLGRMGYVGGVWFGSLARSAMLFSFLAAGYVWAARKEWAEKHRREILWVSVIAYPALLALEWPPLESSSWFNRAATTLMQNGSWRYGFAIKVLAVTVVTPLIQFCAALAAIVILFILYERLPVSVLRPQAALGRRTLGIYAIHFPILFFTVQVLGIRNLLLATAIALGGSYLGVGLIGKVPVARFLLLGDASPRQKNSAPDQAPRV